MDNYCHLVHPVAAWVLWRPIMEQWSALWWRLGSYPDRDHSDLGHSYPPAHHIDTVYKKQSPLWLPEGGLCYISSSVDEPVQKTSRLFILVLRVIPPCSIEVDGCISNKHQVMLSGKYDLALRKCCVVSYQLTGIMELLVVPGKDHDLIIFPAIDTVYPFSLMGSKIVQQRLRSIATTDAYAWLQE